MNNKPIAKSARRLPAVIAAVAVAGACSDATAPERVPEREVIEGVPGAWVRSDGRVRTYQWVLPTRIDSGTRVLIVLHGSGGDGADIRRYADFDGAADHGFVVVYPDAFEGQWGIGCNCTTADAHGIDDVRFMRTLLAQITDAHPLMDGAVVFAAGFSQGSMMAQRLTCDLGAVVRGFGGVGGGQPWAVDRSCARSAPLVGALIHGVEDPLARWDGDPAIQSLPGSASAWANRMGCTTKQRIALPDTEADSTSVWLDQWTGCGSGSAFRLYGVDGGGHTWPGSNVAFPPSFGRTTRDISATQLILELFNQE